MKSKKFLPVYSDINTTKHSKFIIFVNRMPCLTKTLENERH